MIILPAIDIQNGAIARSASSKLTPLEQAKVFAELGATHLHLVDLDAAMGTGSANTELLKKIVRSTSLSVEVSAGIRTLAQLETYKDCSPWQIILASTTVFDPAFARAALQMLNPAVLTVSLDVYGGNAAARGVLKSSSLPASEAAKQMARLGFRRFIVTDVSRDGSLGGLNIELMQSLRLVVPECALVLSGGARSLDDIRAARAAGAAGVIVGKALYNGMINLADALTL